MACKGDCHGRGVWFLLKDLLEMLYRFYYGSVVFHEVLTSMAVRVFHTSKFKNDWFRQQFIPQITIYIHWKSSNWMCKWKDHYETWGLKDALFRTSDLDDRVYVLFSVNIFFQVKMCDSVWFPRNRQPKTIDLFTLLSCNCNYETVGIIIHTLSLILPTCSLHAHPFT